MGFGGRGEVGLWTGISVSWRGSVWWCVLSAGSHYGPNVTF